MSPTVAVAAGVGSGYEQVALVNSTPVRTAATFCRPAVEGRRWRPKSLVSDGCAALRRAGLPLAVAIAIGTAPGLALAQEADDCNALLTHGLRNVVTSGSSSSTEQFLFDNACSSDYSQ